LDAEPDVKGTLEVPNGPLAGLTALFGIISGLTASGGLATFLAITQPDARQAREFKADDARMKALTQALQIESPEGRAMSIRLLVTTGVLEPENPGALDELLEDPAKLPRWPSGTAGSGTQARSPGTQSVAQDTGTAPVRR
jgi:hypothetical protein